jgi:hypothetical protein
VDLWGSFCGFALGSFLYSSFFSFSFFNKTPYYLSKKKKRNSLLKYDLDRVECKKKKKKTYCLPGNCANLNHWGISRNEMTENRRLAI